MKKYLVVIPFSLFDKALLLTDEIIYAEEVRKMTHVYSPRTKKIIGKVSTEKFKELVMEIPV